MKKSLLTSALIAMLITATAFVGDAEAAPHRGGHRGGAPAKQTTHVQKQRPPQARPHKAPSYKPAQVKPQSRPTQVKQQPRPQSRPSMKPQARPQPRPEMKPQAKPQPRPEMKPQTKPQPRPEMKPNDRPNRSSNGFDKNRPNPNNRPNIKPNDRPPHGDGFDKGRPPHDGFDKGRPPHGDGFDKGRPPHDGFDKGRPPHDGFDKGRPPHGDGFDKGRPPHGDGFDKGRPPHYKPPIHRSHHHPPYHHHYHGRYYLYYGIFVPPIIYGGCYYDTIYDNDAIIESFTYIQPSKHPNQFLFPLLRENGHPDDAVFCVTYDGQEAYQYDLRHGTGSFYRIAIENEPKARKWKADPPTNPNPPYITCLDDFLYKYHFTPSPTALFDGKHLYKFDADNRSFVENQTIEGLTTTYKHGDIYLIHATPESTHPYPKYYLILPDAIYETTADLTHGYIDFNELNHDTKKLWKIIK